mgnify:CR=1 FL=1|jgi:hypothetical protein
MGGRDEFIAKIILQRLLANRAFKATLIVLFSGTVITAFNEKVISILSEGSISSGVQASNGKFSKLIKGVIVANGLEGMPAKLRDLVVQSKL